jgi:drug/metabolite transporter (DMT)-like permease
LAHFGVLHVCNGQFAVAKIGVRVGLLPYDIVALRFGFAALILVPWLLIKRFNAKGLAQAAGVGWARAWVLALIAGSPYAYLIFLGSQLAPAAHGAMILPAMTLLVGLGLGAWWLGEPVGARRAVGAVALLCGLVLLGAHGLAGQGGSTSTSWAGDGVLLLAGLCWGLYTVLVKRWSLVPIAAAAVLTLISLLYLPIYGLFLSPRLAQVPFTQVLLQGVFHGFFQSVGVMVGYSYAVRQLGAGRVAMGIAVVPAIGVLTGIPLVGEWPVFTTWLGLAAICAGLMVANWPKRAA